MADGRRTLWLLRHAKARSEPPPGGRDRDRPLSGRGVRDADGLGQLLADPGARQRHGLPAGPVELVLCSSARRTAQTAAAVTAPMAPAPEVRTLDLLYGASPATVVELLGTLHAEIRSVLVVGHNPTIGVLGTLGTPVDEVVIFPTCALAVLEVDATSWSGLDPDQLERIAALSPPFSGARSAG